MRCGAPLQQTVGERAPSAGSSYGPPQATPVGQATSVAPEYAGFWPRFLAVLIDGVITQLIVLVPAFFLGVTLGIAGAAAGQDNESIAGAATLLGAVIGLAASWLYEAGLIASSRQATLGKMALGIMVTDLDGRRIGFGRATGRYFAKILSGLMLAIGYLIQPFTARKQALHDMLAGTLVVKK